MSNDALRLRRVPWHQRVLLAAFDVVAVCTAYAVAAWGTADWSVSVAGLGTAGTLVALSAINVVVFAALGMYSVLWRYASISECGRVFAATAVAAVIADAVFTFAFHCALSLRAYVFAWAVELLLCGGVRLCIRALAGNQGWRFGFAREAPLPRTLVVGAGEAGSLTVKRMLAGDPDMPGNPVAIVDDDRAKQGMRLHPGRRAPEALRRRAQRPRLDPHRGPQLRRVGHPHARPSSRAAASARPT